MPSFPLARLSGDGRRVLCFRPGCTGLFGTIGGRGRAHVSLGSGWQWSPKGYYELTSYARRRYKRGIDPRGRPYHRKIAQHGTPANNPLPGVMHLSDIGDDEAVAHTVASIIDAAAACCPRCGWKSLIDPSALAVERRAWEARMLPRGHNGDSVTT